MAQSVATYDGATFGEAFKNAHFDLGAGKIFRWSKNNQLYKTDRGDGRDLKKERENKQKKQNNNVINVNNNNNNNNNNQKESFKKIIRREIQRNETHKDMSSAVNMVCNAVTSAIKVYTGSVTPSDINQIMEQIKETIKNFNWSHNVENDKHIEHFLEGNTYIWISIIRNNEFKSNFGIKSYNVSYRGEFILMIAENQTAKNMLKDIINKQAIQALNYINKQQF